MLSQSPRRVNRVMASKANVFFLDPAHFRPLVFSILLALIIGQGFDLGIWATILIGIWPFATWLLVVGKRPRDLVAQFHRKRPRWRIAKVLHRDPFHKHKVPIIRVSYRS